jgi:PAS domain S-box-containing protein
MVCHARSLKAEDMQGELSEAGELLPMPFWRLNLKGECDFANRRWLEFTGQKAGDALQKGWESCVHPEDLPDYQREREIARHTRKFNLIMRLRRFDGIYRGFHVVFNPQQDPQGRATGHLVFGVEMDEFRPSVAVSAAPSTPLPEGEQAQDFTPPERTRTIASTVPPERILEVLLASEERLRWVFENIPVMVVALDAQNRIVSWNRECEHVTGYSADEAIGNESLIAQLFHQASDRDWLLRRENHEDAPGHEHECEISCRGGATKIVSIRNITHHVPIPGWKRWWITMDITERKRSEAEKTMMERRLQEAQKLESIGVLAGGVAHDFNNILTSVLGNASLARMELAPTANVQQYLKRIEQASLRAADLCKQMLAYAGKGRFFEQELDVNEVIRDSESMLHSLVGKKAVLNLHLGSHLPLVSTDPSQIRQVLINLVVNAAEALGDQGGTVTVGSRAVQLREEHYSDYLLSSNLAEGVYVVIEVSDNGCGMTPETIERIFDPFFSTKFAGRGLGLAAVQGIVRGHRGALKVKSQAGRGTLIQALFPGIPKDRNAGGRSALPPLLGTVLVIDDEETVLSVAASFLESYGLTALLAKEGHEGVALLREKSSEISAVLLDFTMPRMDGVRAFRELRVIRHDVPIFLMSGYNERDALADFIGKDLAGFIQKPFSHEGLYERLKTVLAPAAH